MNNCEAETFQLPPKKNGKLPKFTDMGLPIFGEIFSKSKKPAAILSICCDLCVKGYSMLFEPSLEQGQVHHKLKQTNLCQNLVPFGIINQRKHNPGNKQQLINPSPPYHPSIHHPSSTTDPPFHTFLCFLQVIRSNNFAVSPVLLTLPTFDGFDVRFQALRFFWGSLNVGNVR